MITNEALRQAVTELDERVDVQAVAIGALRRIVEDALLQLCRTSPGPGPARRGPAAPYDDTAAEL